MTNTPLEAKQNKNSPNELGTTVQGEGKLEIKKQYKKNPTGTRLREEEIINGTVVNDSAHSGDCQ